MEPTTDNGNTIRIEEKDPNNGNKTANSFFKQSVKFLIMALIVLGTITILTWIYYRISLNNKTSPSNEPINTTKVTSNNQSIKPTAKPDLLPSTYGKLTLLNNVDNGVITTIGELLPVLGSVDTDGLYYLEVSLNGKSIFPSKYDTYVYGAWDSFYKEHFTRKFSTLIKELQSGSNKLKIELYSSETKERLLDTLLVEVRSDTTNKEASYTKLTDGKSIPPLEFFNENGFLFQQIWEYAQPFTPTDNQNEPYLEFINGIEIFKIGTIKKDGVNLPVYLLRYGSFGPGHPSMLESTYIGYSLNKKFYYFTNSVNAKNQNDVIYQWDMIPAEESLANSVATLNKIDIPNTKDYLIPDTDSFVCRPEKNEIEIYAFGKYSLHKGYYVSDDYNMCREYKYVANFYESKKFAFNRYLTQEDQDFITLNIKLNSGKDSSGSYSPYWYWCGGSRGYRFLDDASTSSLTEIGKTKTGEIVYIFGSNFKYPQTQHLLPMDIESQELVSEIEWSSFLQNQTNDYPILVIKDGFNNFQVYIKKDYLFLPGC